MERRALTEHTAFQWLEDRKQVGPAGWIVESWSPGGFSWRQAFTGSRKAKLRVSGGRSGSASAAAACSAQGQQNVLHGTDDPRACF